MSLVNNIWNGLKQGMRFRRIAFYTLMIQLVLSTMIGILSYNYIHISIGHSTNLFKIIDGYDHDVLQDLLRFESTGWAMIKAFTSVVILLYLLTGPFIMGGLLQAYRETKDQWETFWKGGTKFYISFLKLNSIILCLFLVLSALLVSLVYLSITYGHKHFLTEIPALAITAVLILLFFLTIIILVSISTHAKWAIITREAGVWNALGISFNEVRQKLTSYLMLGILFLMISLGFAVSINFIINYIHESGFLLVFLALVLQIFSLFVRVCLRNGYYAAILGGELRSDK